MSDDVQHPTHGREPNAPIPFKPPRRRRRRGRTGKPKLRKLRVFSILIGFGALALVSTVFGMMMAVASDIPQIENEQQYKHELANSFLYDDHWRPIGLLAPPNNVVIDSFTDISPSMQDAIVSIEDKRFWSNLGVDIRGIGRSFFADVTGESRQAASRLARRLAEHA